MLTAIISSPKNGHVGVMFYYETDHKQDHTKPSWYLPCDDFDHAAAVVNAFRKQG